MLFSYRYERQRIEDNKKCRQNAGKLLAILIAMQMWRYDAGRNARWSTSRALLEATG